MRSLALDVLESPAAFLSTTVARRRSLRVRRSCLRAGRLSLGLTVARPVLPIRNVLRATRTSRAARGRTMSALSVSTPVAPGLPNSRIVTTPRRFTDTEPNRALAGAVGGVGGGGGGGGGGVGFASASARSIAPAASTAPPVAVNRARSPLGFAPSRMACTTWAGGAPGSVARTSAATPATCGVAMDVPLMAM